MATARDEAAYLHSNGLLEAGDLLRAWAQTTPQAIFPLRKLGQLSEGYEANFLVLRGNPLDDIENIHRIAMRIKNGVPLGTTGSGSSRTGR